MGSCVSAGTPQVGAVEWSRKNTEADKVTDSELTTDY